MALKTDMLRSFVTVARCGNLSDAAKALGRTPSAISMMLKQMEEHLGSPLFETDRKNKLTALGMFSLEEASRELEHFDRATKAIESYAKAKAGIIRIAVVPSIAENMMPKIIRLFAEMHPDVHIDIQDMDSDSVLRELERESVDLGIATGSKFSSRVESHELFSDDFGIVCHTSHEIANLDRPVKWTDLQIWPFIANGLCAHIPNEHLQERVQSSRLMVRNTTSLLAMVRANIGLTVLPRLVVDPLVNDLLFIPISEQQLKRQIDLLQRSNSRLPPATQIFRDIVLAHASEYGAN